MICMCRYRAPFTTKAWKEKFRHVVGIMHTNYLMYSRQETAAMLKEPMLYVINKVCICLVIFFPHVYLSKFDLAMTSGGVDDHVIYIYCLNLPVATYI